MHFLHVENSIFVLPNISANDTHLSTNSLHAMRSHQCISPSPGQRVPAATHTAVSAHALFGPLAFRRPHRVRLINLHSSFTRAHRGRAHTGTSPNRTPRPQFCSRQTSANAHKKPTTGRHYLERCTPFLLFRRKRMATLRTVRTSSPGGETVNAPIYCIVLPHSKVAVPAPPAPKLRLSFIYDVLGTRLVWGWRKCGPGRSAAIVSGAVPFRSNRSGPRPRPRPRPPLLYGCFVLFNSRPVSRRSEYTTASCCSPSVCVCVLNVFACELRQWTHICIRFGGRGGGAGERTVVCK